MQIDTRVASPPLRFIVATSVEQTTGNKSRHIRRDDFVYYEY